jgi:hypothetical protein
MTSPPTEAGQIKEDWLPRNRADAWRYPLTRDKPEPVKLTCYRKHTFWSTSPDGTLVRCERCLQVAVSTWVLVDRKGTP